MKKEFYSKIRSELDFRKSLSPLLKHVAGDGLLAFLLYQACAWNSWTSLLVFPIVTVLMFRNFSLMHEAVHSTLGKNKSLNSFVGFYSGVICLLPYELWKQSHLKHHYWAGNYEQDDVLMIVKKFPKSSALNKKVFDFFWRSKIPYAGFSQNVVFWINAGRHWKSNPRSLRHAGYFLAPLTLWGFLLSQLSNFQTLTLAVGLISYWRLVEVINLPHHVGLYLETQGDHHVPARDQHLISRSCRYPSWIERHITLNFNYHSEHHLFPDLPWHQLHIAHEKLIAFPKESQLNVASHQWLVDQQKKSFGEFLFPKNTNIADTTRPVESRESSSTETAGKKTAA